MPFASRAQQRWMFAKKPEMAKRWAAHTPDIKSLPEHKKKEASSAIDEALGGGSRLLGKLDAGIQGLGQSAASGAASLGVPQLRNYIGGDIAKPTVAHGLGNIGAAVGGRGAHLGRARNVGAGVLGAGALGVAGLYKLISKLTEKSQPQEPKLAETIGTPFTDGLFKFCLDAKLTGDQVADILEKGAEQTGRTGDECRGLLDRILAST